jgi:peptide/nickel transport system permease protein
VNMQKTEHPRLKRIDVYPLSHFPESRGHHRFHLLLFFVGVAVLAPVICPPKYAHAPYKMPHKGFSPLPSRPAKSSIMGTTSGQYDIYYGVIWGTRTAFKIGLFVVCIGLRWGWAWDRYPAYYGGIVDRRFLMRLTDIMWAIPTLVLAMAIVVALGGGLDNIMIALALVAWRWYVRVTRVGNSDA